MYMKNYKTLYKIITLSLVFSGCLYNYNMHNIYASDLNIVNEKGDDYLVEDGSGTFKFLDGSSNYDKISYTKEDGHSSDIRFLNINNKKVEVLTKSLEIKVEDPTIDSIYVSNGELNIGTEDNPINDVLISGCVYSRPGEIVANNNGTINFFVNNMEVSSDEKDNDSRKGHKMVFTMDGYASNSIINVNANSNLKIKGNIGVGYLGEFIGGNYSATKNCQININNSSSSGTVQIEGDIYTGNILLNGTEYRDNNISVIMQDANSYLKGRVVDYYYVVTNESNRKEGTNLSLINGSKWDMTGSSYITDLNLEKDSVVNLNYSSDVIPKKNYRVLRVYNDLIGNGGTFNMDIDASKNVENSDRIYISGTHEGTHYIALNNIGASTDGAKGTVLVSVADEQGDFKASDSEGTLYWNTYKLSKKTDDVTKGYTVDWVLDKVEKNPDLPTTSVDTILSTNALNYHTWRTENDKLLQRMGELRHNGEESKGAWFRVKGSKIGRDGKFGFENKYTAYELGYDEVIKRTEDKIRYQGVAFSYTDGSSSYSRGGGDNSSKAISFYNTEIGRKGHYLDLVFKINNMDNDFTVYDTNSNKITGDFNNTGVALSAEYGRKNALKNGWYIEPQAQFTIGYLGGDNYITSNGIEVNQSGIKSAVGRIGFNIGKEIGGKGIVYAKANLLHEFGGDYDVSMTDSTGRVKVSDSFNDTWFEYGIGAAFAYGKNSHVYFDVERSAGSDFTKNWQWNIGARWNF
ncbi:autotransporter family protein [Phascolarctobacterium faecium]|uniref:autotransporter family protein n=1 Tax=Phascolarctobacterium faecium TaxID=33025 RepID=UPI00210D9104|nr:autotransporter outer membrane beta-barrel domain-containing protein [Phascolarctobacterium faecium]MCQ5184206.1 autotransporter outer membrane beta-barrel domain-containing protein [Phascolarctobacterium faecium]